MATALSPMPPPVRRTRQIRRSRRPRGGRDDRGVAALMTAILMPAVLFMTMLVVQAGVYWNTQQRATAAAKRAAAAASLTSGTEAAGEQAGWDFLDGATIQGADVEVERGPDEVTATVTGDVAQVVPGITFTVAAVETMPVERFIPESEP
jgi:Flp pilus assembly protein TadG